MSPQLSVKPTQGIRLGWDIPGSAWLGDCHFSSIHMSWHFEQVGGEVDRPVYMTAKMTHDRFKGGLTSAYETAGATATTWTPIS